MLVPVTFIVAAVADFFCLLDWINDLIYIYQYFHYLPWGPIYISSLILYLLSMVICISIAVALIKGSRAFGLLIVYHIFSFVCCGWWLFVRGWHQADYSIGNIATVIFTIALLIYVAKNKETYTFSRNQQEREANHDNEISVEQMLIDLHEKYKNGTLTQEEYLAKREELVAKL